MLYSSSTNNNELLYSISDTKLLAMIEVKPEFLMTKLIKGTELNDEEEVEITNDKKELYDLYNSAVEKVDYGTGDYTKYEKIMKIIQQAYGIWWLMILQYDMITSYVRIWFLKHVQDNAKYHLHISMVPIKQQHTNIQASFLECLHYFKSISSMETNAYSSPLKFDQNDYQEDLDSLGQDQLDSSDNYKPISKHRKTNNSELSTRIT